MRAALLALLLSGCTGSQLDELGTTLASHKDAVEGVCRVAGASLSPEDKDARCKALREAYAHGLEAYNRGVQCAGVPDAISKAIDRLKVALGH